MAKDKRPLLAGLKDEIALLGGDLRELAAAHWQLARLEVESDAAAVKRLAVAMVAAAVMALSALPLLAVAAADALDGWLGIARLGWLLIFGVGLLILAASTGCLAWRGFRRRFTALEQTREELREAAVWLEEWARREG
jgi:hypothetical protein